MKEERVIDAFRGAFGFLSNFWPCEVTMPDGITYPSSEHAYMAQKSDDLAVRRRVAALPGPGAAKRFGRTIELRKDWDAMKRDVMFEVVAAKFIQNENLGLLLMATRDARLVEGNTWNDRYWGVCDGKGENHLGVILMTVRTALQTRRDEDRRAQARAPRRKAGPPPKPFKFANRVIAGRIRYQVKLMGAQFFESGMSEQDMLRFKGAQATILALLEELKEPVDLTDLPIIVYGPEACGKTRNAERLRLRFNAASVVDEWRADMPLTEGAIHLTNDPTCLQRYPRRVVRYDETLQDAK